MIETIINHYSSSDIDGTGCTVLTMLLAKQIGGAISVEHCAETDADQRVKRLVDSIRLCKYYQAPLPMKRIVVLTGVNVSQEILQQLIELDGDRTEIVQISQTEDGVCMTKALYEKLQVNERQSDIRLVGNWAVDTFVQDVSAIYLNEQSDDVNPVQMEVLLQKIGCEALRDAVVESLSSRRPFIVRLSPYESVVEQAMKEMQTYCEDKAARATVLRSGDSKARIVFAERYQKEILAMMAEETDTDVLVVCSLMPLTLFVQTPETAHVARPDDAEQMLLDAEENNLFIYREEKEE